MEVRGPLLGILGGMGPLATADFMVQLATLANAKFDQDHCRTLVYSDPGIPDRSAALMGRGRSPLPALLDGIAMLERCGVDGITIPCNTAHCWLNEIIAATTIPIVSIADAVISDLARRQMTVGRVGLLATPGLTRSGLYQRCLKVSGYDVVVPTHNEFGLFIEPAIRAVKAGNITEAREPLDCAVRALEDRGADVNVLACTELPLAVEGPMSRRGRPLIDSTRCLALACLAWIAERRSDVERARDGEPGVLVPALPPPEHGIDRRAAAGQHLATT